MTATWNGANKFTIYLCIQYIILHACKYILWLSPISELMAMTRFCVSDACMKTINPIEMVFGGHSGSAFHFNQNRCKWSRVCEGIKRLTHPTRGILLDWDNKDLCIISHLWLKHVLCNKYRCEAFYMASIL